MTHLCTCGDEARVLDDGFILCIHHGIIGHVDGKKLS